jgi:hypothetical protein
MESKSQTVVIHQGKRHKGAGAKKAPPLALYYSPGDQNKISRMRLILAGSITTNGAGAVASAIGMNPSGASEWSQFSVLFDEFRVMSIRLHLLPTQQGSVTASNALCVFCYDNDNTSSLSTLVQGIEYDTAHVIPSIWYDDQRALRNFTWSRPLNGVDSSVSWVDCAAPTGSLGAIKYYVQGTASTTYFSYFVEWFVEFRGRI